MSSFYLLDTSPALERGQLYKRLKARLISTMGGGRDTFLVQNLTKRLPIWL